MTSKAKANRRLSRLIRATTVKEHFGGISDMTLWRWIQYRDFPRPMKINGRNYWYPGEVENWRRENES